MEGRIAWFRCRKCGLTVQDRYLGQWYTEFPICKKCGIEESEVDTLAEPVFLHLRSKFGTPDPFPDADTPWGSTRYGPGMEQTVSVTCQHPLGPWSMEKHGSQLALFRCRKCNFETKATYKGQWKTTFPVCKGVCGANAGKMDCLDWWGDTFTNLLPFRSSRYGPGTEVLDCKRYRTSHPLQLNFPYAYEPPSIPSVQYALT